MRRLKNYLGMATVTLTAVTILAGVARAADSDAELAKKTQNPIANLISLPLQSDLNYDNGPNNDKTSYTLNVQPVWPFSVSEDYLLITPPWG